MRARRGSRVVGSMLLLLGGLAACDASVLLVEPASPPAGLEIRLVESDAPAGAAVSEGQVASAEGAGRAFDRVDAIRVRIVAEGGVLLDETFPVDPSGGQIRLGVEVELEDPEVPASLELELLVGGEAVFRGGGAVTLRQGGSSRADVEMLPVGIELLLPADPETLTALGDTVQLTGDVLFVTGDTVPDPAISWVSLDPEVVEASGSNGIAVGEGEARLEASFDGMADTMVVRVEQVVEALGISPEEAELVAGEERQFTAEPVDRRGNPVTGRTEEWMSSDPAVASVDDQGVVRGETPGSAEISVTVEGMQATAAVTVDTRAPQVETLQPSGLAPGEATLRARVNPGGVSVEVVFEWARDPELLGVDSFQSPPQTLAAGGTAVVVTHSTSLQPEVTYYVRARASGPEGGRTGSIVQFATPEEIPTPENASATWNGFDSVRVDWDHPPEVEDIQFEVERAPVEAQLEQVGTWARIGTTTEEVYFDPTPGEIGDTFAYRVRACRPTYCSDYSNESWATLFAPG